MKKRVFTMLLAVILCFGVASVPALAAGMPFTDVPRESWYYDDVASAVETGLINGKTPTKFCPNDELTYVEAIKLAACMHQKYTTGAVTLKNGEPWYKPYVEYCREHGIIKKDYDLNAVATRAGYMEIFASALPDEALEPINLVEDGAIPDVPMSHPQAEAIYKLYRAGVVQGVDEAHCCRPDSTITRAEVASIVTRMMDKDSRISFTLRRGAYLEAYIEILKEIHISNKWARFIFAYIDGDDTPELLVIDGSMHSSQVTVYTWYAGKVVKVGVYGEYGEFMYVSKANVICSFHMQDGVQVVKYVGIEKGAEITVAKPSGEFVKVSYSGAFSIKASVLIELSESIGPFLHKA